jgi:hypothetical protein
VFDDGCAALKPLTLKYRVSSGRQFTAADINRHLEFDCARHLKLLCRGNFLEAEKREDGVLGFSRTGEWPPTEDDQACLEGRVLQVVLDGHYNSKSQ